MTQLTFSDYQVHAEETAMYPREPKVLALAYCALGLGEAGEVQGKVKKIIRDAGGTMTEEVRKAILSEVGDLLWYGAMITRELDADLGDVAEANLAKLKSRKQRGQIQGSGDNR
jgi:NTP pyrophosphatase (non-canonical NTP hydrolase)